ncbi:MAG: hypothetical protein CL579_05230 [Alteromonadaceae bacterium]|jgi:hypothetical protein|nr:hypothetical protein [Alteromonadaceae bacterium]
MKHASIIFLSAYIFTNSVWACSFGGGAELFVPTLERWEEHAGPAQSDPNSDGEYWESVPSPVVKVINVTRGSASAGHSCADAGTITLEVTLPKESTYSIEEFGVYFRVLSGKEPDLIFPDIPLTGQVKNGKATFFFAWLDGHPSQQFPINLEVDAFFVTNSLNVGKSKSFNVSASKG